MTVAHSRRDAAAEARVGRVLDVLQRVDDQMNIYISQKIPFLGAQVPRDGYEDLPRHRARHPYATTVRERSECHDV